MDSVYEVSHSLIGSTTYHIADPTNLNGLVYGNAPQFSGATDFQLLFSSPAIGRGSNGIDLDGSGDGTLEISDISDDLNGAARISGGNVDMGVYQFVYEGAFLDSDTDGLSDSYEQLHTDPVSSIDLDPTLDLDGDGLTVLEEFAFGLLPNTADAVQPELFVTQSLVFVPAEDPFSPIGGFVESRDCFTVRYTIDSVERPYLYFTPEQTSSLGGSNSWASDDLLVYDTSENQC